MHVFAEKRSRRQEQVEIQEAFQLLARALDDLEAKHGKA
jgi:hypothetical protein